MAKKQKTIDTTKLNTLLSFTDLVEKDVQKGERRIFGQRHIDQIEKEQARDFVQEKFDAYIQATEAFNRARIEQGVAKLNLQNALDKGFAAQGWVSKEGYWNILGLDDAKNIVYEDTPDRKYEDRFNWLNRRSRVSVR